MSFDNLGLKKELLRATAEQGYTQPSPIQQKAIPPVLSGRDVMAAAQTGTGKTAAFTLPILQLLSGGSPAKSNQARALILTPTRELAAQIDANVADYGRYLNLRSMVVFGGVKINPQMMQLRKGADILVATPGRLLDLYSQNAVRFQQLEILVLDEADRMLDMGFIHDIRKILKVLPAKRQNLMFSATFSKEIRSLAKTIVRDPLEISVSPPNSTVDKVDQWLVPVDKSRKSALLVHLIKQNDWYQLLVFSRTKHGANRIATQLNKQGIQAAAIHGNKSQGARTRALASFKVGEVQVLVATDIAARGIDIDQLPYVVNFDLPNVPEDYVHRIGRTARAGAEGTAVSLVSADEHKSLVDIERLIKQVVERRYEPGFEPDHEVPASNARPVKAAAGAKKTGKRTQRRTGDQRASGNKKPSDRNQPAGDARRRSKKRRSAKKVAGSSQNRAGPGTGS